MAEAFVCWDDESEDDPGVSPPARNCVEAFSVEWAAEEFAERTFGDSDPVESMTIHVRDTDAKVHVVDIVVEYEPTFSGTVRE